jgi:hypothetical protein
MSTTEEHITIVAVAIRDIAESYPASGFGTMRDQIYEPNDQSVPFAQAILAALDIAGYKIVPKDSVDG